MTFVVMGLGTVFNAIANRRDPASGFGPPILKALVIALIPLAMLFLGTQLPTLQQALLTTTLSPSQWLICAGLAALLPVVIEISKAIRRRRAPEPGRVDVEQAVSPERAHRTASHTDGHQH
jgi:Ca2+-transporting ATPase